MQAIEIRRFGPAEGLQLVDRDLPRLNAGEVLIRVAASGINRPDILQRKGLYPPPDGVTDIPGLEVSGVIESGDATTLSQYGLHLGQPVCALVPGGGYAEYCAAHAALCLPVPDGVTLEEAATLPETFFTVWSNLFDQARLQTGDFVLIHGGASGIGTTAIQLAKAFGAKVIVTVGTEEKLKFCLQLGADYAINYQAFDFVPVIADITKGQGVNIVLDIVGGHYLPRNIECMRTDARLQLLSLLGGPKAIINFAAVLQKRLTIKGSTLRTQSIEFKSDIARSLVEKVWPLFASRQIRPVVDQIFSSAEVVSAHQKMEASQHTGKLLLRWAGEF